MIYMLATNNNLLISQTILIIVLLCLAIVFCCYGIIAARKVAIAAKKFDYFVEDLTYKSEMLNSTVDTVVKVSNYIDVFEAFAKRNVKAWVKIIARNKDIAYRIVDKLKDFANSDWEGIIMAFRFVKTLAVMLVGMLIAPKKGSELQQDFINLVKKYNPQLKKMVNKIEIVWEKSQGIESDEVAADIELHIKNVKGAVEILDSASTKEMAYKTLKKIDNGAVKLIKAAAKSPNVRAVAQDLAKITVSAIDAGIKVTEDLKKTSASISEKIIEEGKSAPIKKDSKVDKK